MYLPEKALSYKNILVNSQVKGIFFYSKFKSHLSVYLCTGLALNFKQIFNSTQYLGLVVKAGSSNGQPAGLLRLNFLGKNVMLGKRWTMGLVRSMMALLDPQAPTVTSGYPLSSRSRPPDREYPNVRRLGSTSVAVIFCNKHN